MIPLFSARTQLQQQPNCLSLAGTCPWEIFRPLFCGTKLKVTSPQTTVKPWGIFAGQTGKQLAWNTPRWSTKILRSMSGRVKAHKSGWPISIYGVLLLNLLCKTHIQLISEVLCVSFQRCICDLLSNTYRISWGKQKKNLKTWSMPGRERQRRSKHWWTYAE